MLDKNLEILKKKNKVLYDKITTHELSDKYKVVSSKNRMPNLVTEGNKYIHSRYNPEIEAQKWVNGINPKEDSIFVIGFGLGYYLDKLIEKHPKKTIFIAEPNIEIFIHAISTRDLTKELKNDNVFLLVNMDKESISNVLIGHIYFNYIKKINFIQLPYYKSFKKDYTDKLLDNIHKNIYNLRGEISTRLYFANRWIDNIIRNLKYISYDTNSIDFKGLATNIPVIIVSAGPSLEKNMDLLTKIYNKAIIIAVGSAVNILESRNITPHFVMGIDGSEAESKIFNSMKNTDPIFLYALTVHYDCVEKYTGRRSWIGLDVQSAIDPILNEYFNEYSTITSGPSVANFALDLAYNLLGAKKIMFIGQDLAYTSSKIYAEGNIHEGMNEQNRDYSEEIYVRTEDIYGKEIYTKKTFLNMKNWFEKYIKTHKVNNLLYNCTEGGLNIVGMENMKFKKAIEEFCIEEYKIEELLNVRYDLDNKDIVNTERYFGFLNKMKVEIDELTDLSNDRIELLSKLIQDVISKKNNVRFNKRFENVVRIGKKIEKMVAFHYFIYPLLKTYLDITTTGANRGIEKENNDKIDVAKTLLNQYLVVDNSIKVAKKAFENN